MKISIIIATYNSSKTLRRSLDSVVEQKGEEVELVVIDGASTDGTLTILDEYREHIDIWLSEPDSGIYDAWNKGVRASSGDWIMFLGSDDILCGGIANTILKNLEKTSDVDYISGKVRLIDDVGMTIRTIGKKLTWRRFRRYMCVAHVGSLHNRTLYEKYGYYDTEFMICGDYEFLLRAGKTIKANFINEVVAEMTVGGVSYASKTSLIEARKAKVKNEINSNLINALDYYWATCKLGVKKCLGFD